MTSRMIWWAGDHIRHSQIRDLPNLGTRLILTPTNRLRPPRTNRGRNPFLQFSQLRGIGQIVMIHPTTLTRHPSARCHT